MSDQVVADLMKWAAIGQQLGNTVPAMLAEDDLTPEEVAELYGLLQQQVASLDAYRATMPTRDEVICEAAETLRLAFGHLVDAASERVRELDAVA